jgi:hypothetical protein
VLADDLADWDVPIAPGVADQFGHNLHDYSEHGRRVKIAVVVADSHRPPAERLGKALLEDSYSPSGDAQNVQLVVVDVAVLANESDGKEHRSNDDVFVGGAAQNLLLVAELIDFFPPRRVAWRVLVLGERAERSSGRRLDVGRTHVDDLGMESRFAVDERRLASFKNEVANPGVWKELLVAALHLPRLALDDSAAVEGPVLRHAQAGDAVEQFCARF